LLRELGGAVLFRDKDLPEEQRMRRAAALRVETARVNVPLLVHGDAELAHKVGADGVHYSANSTTWKRSKLLKGASCHDAMELQRAVHAGLDYVTLSPVHSSPGKGTALGWERFSELTQPLALPVFALGGLGPSDLLEAQRHGAWGVAGIRSFCCRP